MSVGWDVKWCPVSRTTTPRSFHQSDYPPPPLLSGVTKTRNGKWNGMENGMKRKICNAIYVCLWKTYIHYLWMNHPSCPLTM